MPAAPRPPRLRPKVAAIGIVGGVMVALPMIQVLRYQGAEIQAAQTEREALDPMARAVELERGLLAHRELAGRVLQGRLQFEPQRKLRQGEVDVRVAELDNTLALGAWEPAYQEAQALAVDWQRLANEVGARSISAEQSDQAHRLCVEQTLQVIDLVSLALAPDTGPAAVAQALPRLAWQLALLTPAGTELPDAAARQRGIDAAEARLARTLHGLDGVLARRPNPALAEAGAAAGAAARRYLQLLGGEHGDPQPAAQAALQAQIQLYALASADIAAAVEQRLANAEGVRTRLGGLLAALALALALLSWSLVRGLRRAASSAAPPAASDPPTGASAGTPAGTAATAATGPSAHGAEAGRLLERLRQAGAAGANTAPSATAEPAPPPRA